MRWYRDDFKIRNNEGTRDLYLYEKHSAPGGQAALTGTLSYTVKVGSSLTEAQIKEAASVLYREYASAKDNVKIPQYGTPETTTDKLDQAMRSAQDFADVLLSGNESGSKTNNSLSFVTFAGFDANNTNESGSNLDYIDSVQTVFTNV